MTVRLWFIIRIKMFHEARHADFVDSDAGSLELPKTTSLYWGGETALVRSTELRFQNASLRPLGELATDNAVQLTLAEANSDLPSENT
jgi:hypothetical protein